MAYSDIYAAATDATSPLRGQVAVAVAKAATDIVNEAANTTNHANRLSWARRVVANNDAPLTEAINMLWKVLENATIQAAPTTAADTDVQFVVNSLVDTFTRG